MLFEGFHDSNMQFSFHFVFSAANVFHSFSLLAMQIVFTFSFTFYARGTFLNGQKFFRLGLRYAPASEMSSIFQWGGRAQKRSIFFHLNFPFNSIFFLFQLFSSIAMQKKNALQSTSQPKNITHYPQPSKQSYCSWHFQSCLEHFLQRLLPCQFVFAKLFAPQMFFTFSFQLSLLSSTSIV